MEYLDRWPSTSGTCIIPTATFILYIVGMDKSNPLLIDWSPQVAVNQSPVYNPALLVCGICSCSDDY